MKPINKNIKKIFTKIIPMGIILIGVSACSVSQNTARESDGIYYNPANEPERRIAEETYYQSNDDVYVAEQPVRIGGRYFDDSGNAPETESYYEDQTYINDRNVVSTSSNDHVQWGDYQGVEVYVNNYYGWNRPYYNSWYSPRWSWNFGWNYGWNYGWNSWGYRPWYSGYYGYGFPHYGYGGYYGPYYGYGYSPYYSGYYGYYGGYPYYNNYYGNRVMREVTRGRGISNGVTRDLSTGQRNLNNHNTALRREAGVTRDNGTVRDAGSVREIGTVREAGAVREVGTVRETQSNVSPRTRVSGEANNSSIRTPNRRDSNVSQDANTSSPIRIRPRTSEEVNTNSGIRYNTPRPTTPNIRQRSSDVRPQQQTPTRYNTPRTQPQQRQRNVSPPPTRNQNVTPSRTPSRSNSSFQSSPSRGSSMGSGVRGGSSGRSSGGGVRR